ncbi:MAG: universal stress protein [Verrucomicrobiota bacterium]
MNFQYHFKNILVGVDFSEGSKAALREAARLASLSDGSVHVVNVVEAEIFSYLHHVSGLRKPEIQLGRDRRMDVFLEEALKGIAGVSVSFQCLVGPRFAEIERKLEELDADLLVLGRTGNRDQSFRHLGSLAAVMAREIPCHVMLVDPDQGEPYANVIAAIDDDEACNDVIWAAVTAARASKAKLHFLHVYFPHWLECLKGHPEFYSLEARANSPSAEELAVKHAEEEKHRFREFLAAQRQWLPEGNVEPVILENPSVAGAMLSYTETVAQSLVVFGRSCAPSNHDCIASSSLQAIQALNTSIFLTERPR